MGFNSGFKGLKNICFVAMSNPIKEEVLAEPGVLDKRKQTLTFNTLFQNPKCHDILYRHWELSIKIC